MSSDITTDGGDRDESLAYPPTMRVDANGFGDCSAFQRDIIWALLRLGGVPDAHQTSDAPYGLAIKRELETAYGVEVNHGRLYPNMDDLVDMGLVSKHQIDRRTNGYAVTERCLEQINEYFDYVKQGTERSVEIAAALRDE